MVSEEALRYATNRIDAFALVQAGQPDKEKALSIMFNAVGLDAIKEDLFEWLNKFYPMVEDQSILLGLLLGLFILQYYRDEYGIPADV